MCVEQLRLDVARTRGKGREFALKVADLMFGEECSERSACFGGTRTEILRLFRERFELAADQHLAAMLQILLHQCVQCLSRNFRIAVLE